MAKTRPLSPRELAAMDRIALTLKAKGWSWSELARRVKKTPSAASQWSGRLAFPSHRTFIAICTELEVAASWVLDGEDADKAPRPATKRQADILRLMADMTPDQEAAILAAAQGIAAHMAKK